MNTEPAAMRQEDKQVTMPADTHRQLKILAAQRETTIRELVVEAVRSYFGLDEAKAS